MRHLRSLRYWALAPAFFAFVAQAEAVSIGSYYSLDEIKKIEISHDSEAAIGLGSELRVVVKAHLKNGKVKPFNKWSKSTVEVRGGKKFYRSNKFHIEVSPELEQIEDHQVHLAIALKSKPEIRGEATIRLNYRGAAHAKFDGAAGSRGADGVKGASWGTWNGGPGRHGKPGGDGQSAGDLVVHIRPDAGSVDGHRLVRVTARTLELERDYLVNVDGGRLLVSANGGAGGKGGDGGKGGKGNDGATKGDRYRAPGNGGDGGSGAYGGNGGNGGRITVFLHPDSRSVYEDGLIEFSSVAGKPGGGGKAGKYGRGGAGRRGPSAVSAGNNGRSGRRGAAGKPGSDGAIYVEIQETPDWSRLTPPPPPGAAAFFVAGQVWEGEYVCGQGRTALELEITEVEGERLSAVFGFVVSSEISGSFLLDGEYVPETRQITFRPGEWISQPTGYVGVGLTGRIDPSDARISGNVDNERCGEFSVSRR